MIYYGEVLFLRMPILKLTHSNINNIIELVDKLELKDYHYCVLNEDNAEIPDQLKYLRLLNSSPNLNMRNPPLIHTSSLTITKPYSNIDNAKKLSFLYVTPINDGIEYLDMTETHGYLVLLVIGAGDQLTIEKLLAKFVDAQYLIFDNKLTYNRDAELVDIPTLQELIDVFVNYRRGKQMKKAS
mgnify:CR=1 FL=1